MTRQAKRKVVAKSGPEPAPKKQKSDISSVLDNVKANFERLHTSDENPSADALLSIFESKLSKEEFDIDAEVSNLQDEQQRQFWTNCQFLISESILGILDQGDETTSVATQHEKVITICVSLAKIGISKVTKDDVPIGFEQSISLLHESLLSLPRHLESLKTDIARLCETWITKETTSPQNFGCNALIQLLRRCLHPHGTKADIKRINNMQFLIPKFYAMDEKVKRSILAAVQSSNFIRSQEGQKFIIFLLTLNSSMVKDVHKAFKGIISGMAKQDAVHIGEMYLKAWTNATEKEDILKSLEEDGIQNFMYHCILARKKSKIFEPLLAILGPFHSSKNNKKVQKMLQRLWEPLLWRYLKVANSEARCNATLIFAEAFPLEDPDAELEVRSAAWDHQMNICQDLLKDEVPEVRATAVHAVTRILSRFWILVSTSDIQKLMVLLIKHLANDMSAPKVRQSVIKGLTHMIKTCPRSHIYLKQILPKLTEVFHDSNEGVRLAMLDLLLAVKSIKTIRFWNICPLEDLLDGLANDKKNISEKIAKLLFNSFFPLDESEDAKLERCVYLITNQAQASRRFYLALAKWLNMHDCVKFMLAILIHLKKHAQDKLANDPDESKENKENQQIVSNLAGGDNINQANSSVDSTLLKDGSIRLANDTLNQALNDDLVVGSLIDIVCILWMSKCQDLAEQSNSEYRALLEKKSSKILLHLFKVYRHSTDVHRSIIYLCSFLPHSSTLTIASFCLAKLKSSKVENDSLSKYPSWTDEQFSEIRQEMTFTTYLDALCNWRRGDDVLEMVINWLNKEDDKVLKPRKGVRFNDPSKEARPGFALVILRYLLSHKLNKAILHRKNLNQLEEVKDVLETKYLPKIEAFCKSGSVEDNKDMESKSVILASAWLVLLQLELDLMLLKEDEDNFDILDKATSRLKTMNEIIAKKKEVNEFDSYILTNLIMFCSNLATLSMVNEHVAEDTIDICCGLLQKENKLERVPIVMTTITEILQWASRDKKATFQSQKTMKILPHIGQILKVAQDIPRDISAELKQSIIQTHDLVQREKMDFEEVAIFESLFEVIDNSLEESTKENQMVYIVEKGNTLSMTLEILASRKLMRMLVHKMQDKLESNETSLIEQAKILSIMTFLQRCFASNSLKADLKSMATELRMRVDGFQKDNEVVEESGNDDPDLLYTINERLSSLETVLAK